jgi:outer membrane lipoprotein-sorting protein
MAESAPSPSSPTRLTPLESGCYIQSFGHIGESPLRGRSSIWIVSLAAVAVFACGCAVSKKTAVKPGQAPGPLQTATKEELITRYNQQAQSVSSLNATVSMKLTAGSAYSGVIEQYHEVNGFILASKPASIRAIGQAPVVGKNVFDMVSNGETFHIYIPSRNKFIEGRADFERQAKKPIENLRPQHLVDALLWKPIADKAIVLFEEANEPTARYYVLTLVRVDITDSSFSAIEIYTREWNIAQKIWFDRTDLNITRVEMFADAGKVNSDTRYSDWEMAGDSRYPRQIAITRPGDDYKLELAIKKLALNEKIAADRFDLQQPAGSELVHVGEDAKEPK